MNGQLIGDNIDYRLFQQDYSGFARAAETQSRGMQNLGNQVAEGIATYKDYEKQGKEMDGKIAGAISQVKGLKQFDPNNAPQYDALLAHLSDPSFSKTAKVNSIGSIAPMMQMAQNGIENAFRSQQLAQSGSAHAGTLAMAQQELEQKRLQFQQQHSSLEPIYGDAARTNQIGTRVTKPDGTFEDVYSSQGAPPAGDQSAEQLAAETPRAEFNVIPPPPAKPGTEDYLQNASHGNPTAAAAASGNVIADAWDTRPGATAVDPGLIASNSGIPASATNATYGPATTRAIGDAAAAPPVYVGKQNIKAMTEKENYLKAVRENEQSKTVETERRNKKLTEYRAQDRVLGVIDKYIDPKTGKPTELLDAAVGFGEGFATGLSEMTGIGFNYADTRSNQKQIQLDLLETDLMEASKNLKPVSEDEMKQLMKRRPTLSDPPETWQWFMGRAKAIIEEGRIAPRENPSDREVEPDPVIMINQKLGGNRSALQGARKN